MAILGLAVGVSGRMGSSQSLDETGDTGGGLFQLLDARGVGAAHEALAARAEGRARHDRDVLGIEQTHGELAGGEAELRDLREGVEGAGGIMHRNAGLREGGTQEVAAHLVSTEHGGHVLGGLAHRLERGPLRGRRRAHNLILVNLQDGVHHPRRGADVGHAKARHRPRLGVAVEEHQALLQARHRSKAHVALAAPGQLCVDFIGDEDEVVAHHEVRNGLHVLALEHRARGVVREVHHQHPRAGRDLGLEGLHGEAEIVLHVSLHRHGHTVGHRNLRPIAHEAGLMIEHLVAGIQQRAQRDVQAFRGADRHEHLVRGVVVPAEAVAHVVGDGAAELHQAGIAGVVALALLQGGDGGLADVPGRVEIRLTDSQGDDPLARAHDVEELADTALRQPHDVLRKTFPAHAHGVTTNRPSSPGVAISTPLCL